MALARKRDADGSPTVGRSMVAANSAWAAASSSHWCRDQFGGTFQCRTRARHLFTAFLRTNIPNKTPKTHPLAVALFGVNYYMDKHIHKQQKAIFPRRISTWDPLRGKFGQNTSSFAIETFSAAFRHLIHAALTGLPSRLSVVFATTIPSQRHLLPAIQWTPVAAAPPEDLPLPRWIRQPCCHDHCWCCL